MSGKRHATLPLALLWLACACACACVVETGPGGDRSAPNATVRKVFDGDTLEVLVNDVVPEKVRLLGVDTPETGGRAPRVEPFGAEATAFTRERTLGQAVRLEKDPQSADRDNHQRLLRHVFLPDGSLLSAEIVARGLGLANTRYPSSRNRELRELEAEARHAGRGMWDPGRIPRLDAAEAVRHYGRIATVCGEVVSATWARSSRDAPTYLNLDRPHPDSIFTVVIWGNDREAFDAPPERALRGRAICATGKIRERRGRPEMFVNHPSQITPRE